MIQATQRPCSSPRRDPAALPAVAAGEERLAKGKQRTALVDGVSLRAEVAADAHDRAALERLLRHGPGWHSVGRAAAPQSRSRPMTSAPVT